MIGACSTCRSLFETATEDAYTPGTQCPRCYRQSRAAQLGEDASIALRERADRLEQALRNLLDSMGGPVFSDPRLRYEVWHVDAGAVAAARAALRSPTNG